MLLVAVRCLIIINVFFQIKDSIVEQVSTVKVSDLQALTQVSSVIARATLEPSEVTVESQVICAARARVKIIFYYANVMILQEHGQVHLITRN